jgi:hypothetical protein
MTIKFSDETKRLAEAAGYSTPGWKRDMNSIASVFEAAANEQVRSRPEFEVTPGLEFCVSAHAGGSGGCSNPATSCGAGGAPGFTTFTASGGGAAPNTHSRVTAPAFEPGKRYRTVGGDIATINRRDDDTEVLFCLHGTIGGYPHILPSWQENGSYGRAGCNRAFDLVPGAVDEAQAACLRHDETYECVIADLTRQVRAAKARAERAEAAIEAARRIIEATVLADTVDAYGRGCDEKSRQIAEAMGMTIRPSRELTVTWNKDN